jgi:hypothetical protein
MADKAENRNIRGNQVVEYLHILEKKWTKGFFF